MRSFPGRFVYDGGTRPASPPEVWRYARLVAAWGRHYYGAELAALDELRVELEGVAGEDR